MSTEPFRRVLEATGYLAGGEPEPGVHLGEDVRGMRRGRDFSPDALWRGRSALRVYFKFAEQTPNDELVGAWRQEIWNEGFTPLLWVISPMKIELYNGFGRPLGSGDAATHRLRTFRNIDSELEKLDALAGRLAMETGQFWLSDSGIDRKTGVDQALLSDLASLESALVGANLDRAAAQALIGRSIFTQFLIDRKIVGPDLLHRVCDHRALPPILRDRSATQKLFTWLGDTFNGDMFPPETGSSPATMTHLSRVADFLEAIDVESGQRSLFPYQFDVIPVELISSIYEQFAHTSAPQSRHLDVYYTRLPVVSLVLDEVMSGLTGRESVLDLTCGSGVFLVEALRRLVGLRANGGEPSRALIRSTLYEQIYGVDISEAAIRIAAFSLYLAALELDPNPRPPQALKFQPLVNRTLIVGDARTIETTPIHASTVSVPSEQKKFDVIIGNPPWSFRGRAGTADRTVSTSPVQSRGEGLDFVLRAQDFAHEKTRFGMLLSAMPFFSGSRAGAAAAHSVVHRLSPVTLVNLSNLSGWLFPTARMPAVALLARHRLGRTDEITVVQVPWSPAGPKTHTFEIAPSDIIQLPLADWERQTVRLKTAAFGRQRDLVLLSTLTAAHDELRTRLAAAGAKLRDGLTLGTPANQTRDASALQGLEILGAKDLLLPFNVPKGLRVFSFAGAQWPRTRETYRAPLLLVKEMVSSNARALAAVADRDLIFTDAYFGAAFPAAQREAASLVAAIVSSALASWFFIMTAAEFGIWKQRLFLQDVGSLPAPELHKAVRSEAASKIFRVQQACLGRALREEEWTILDEAVFDLYNLDLTDRVVVRDGLFRASWEWKAGRLAAVRAADTHTDLSRYARTFLTAIDGWLSALLRRRMRAEVFDLPQRDALRVIRFVLEERPGPSEMVVVQPSGELSEVLLRIEQRLNVKLSNAIIGQRELRVHGPSEVVIIKPAARRHWMGTSALEDADAIIAESITRATA